MLYQGKNIEILSRKFVFGKQIADVKILKEVRLESLRASFKNRWEQKDFNTIVTLGAMIPQNILLEDEALLMYYNIAKDRL
jgi:hypothetical protein